MSLLDDRAMPRGASRAAAWSVRATVLTATALVLAAVSAFVIAPAPSYDPWAWLLWGREVAHGTLDTAEGPAFKPLPVALTTILAGAGDAAPVLWVVLVRAAGCAALALAFVLGRALGRSPWAGAAATVAVAACSGLAALTASGAEPALVLAGALGAIEAWRRGRLGFALALGVACALLRVEAWPFVVVAGVVVWRRAPPLRPWLAGAAVVVPAVWFVPELLGSGDLLRSGSRARVPNPGQPALADVPFLASLRAAVELPPWPVWLGVAAVSLARSRLLWGLSAVGMAWIVLVAVMAQAGFSGEPRYALPGAALLSVSGAVGLLRGAAAASRHASASWPAVLPSAPPRGTVMASVAGAAAGALLLAGVVPRAGGLADIRRAQAHQWALVTTLDDAIGAAGGRGAVLACGQPYVGPLRGPLLAYALRVSRQRVEPDRPPRVPGVVFGSRRVVGAPLLPRSGASFPSPMWAGPWQVAVRCHDTSD